MTIELIILKAVVAFVMLAGIRGAWLRVREVDRTSAYYEPLELPAIALSGFAGGVSDATFTIMALALVIGGPYFLFLF